MVSGFVLLAIAAVIDALARAAGAYAALDVWWPAGWRAVVVPVRANDGIYRAQKLVRWERLVPAGVPRAVSFTVVVAAGFALLWSFAAVAAVIEGAQALWGAHLVWAALASMVLCVTRALIQWALASAVLHRALFRVAVTVAMALTLDLSLAMFALPCSDRRSDDVVVAHIGIAIGFALASVLCCDGWRRRGTLVRDAEAIAGMN